MWGRWGGGDEKENNGNDGDGGSEGVRGVEINGDKERLDKERINLNVKGE